jgi:hypothetical protein
MTTSRKKTTYDIRVSTGAEINQPGHYALYLTIANEDDINGSAHVFAEPSDGSEPDDLDLDAALDYMLQEFHIPRGAWQVARVDPALATAYDASGEDRHGWLGLDGDQTDEYGGFSIARSILEDGDLLAWPTADLMDADTAERIGPATRSQVEASIMAEDADGGAGVILVDEEGHVVGAGSWGAQQDGVRRVYTL